MSAINSNMMMRKGWKELNQVLNQRIFLMIGNVQSVKQIKLIKNASKLNFGGETWPNQYSSKIM